MIYITGGGNPLGNPPTDTEVYRILFLSFSILFDFWLFISEKKKKKSPTYCCQSWWCCCWIKSSKFSIIMIIILLSFTLKNFWTFFLKIPNQPIVFAGEDFGRSEDALLAKTWDLFIQTQNPVVIGSFFLLFFSSFYFSYYFQFIFSFSFTSLFQCLLFFLWNIFYL